MEPRAQPIWLLHPLARPNLCHSAEQTAFQNAINGIADSVVRIEPSGLSVATLQGASEAIPNVGPSSGVVVGSDGWILTTEFAVPSDIEEVVITLPPKKKATETKKQPLERLVGRCRVEPARLQADRDRLREGGAGGGGLPSCHQAAIGDMKMMI